MQQTQIYEDLLRDIIKEINHLALREDNWEDTAFARGYVAGMMVIMKAVQDEINEFFPDDGKSLGLIDVDLWFREGREFSHQP